MKLFHIIARLNIGGPAIYVIQLGQRLSAAGHDVRVIKGQEAADEGDMLDMATEWSVSPVTLPHLRREIHPIRDFLALAGLVRILRKERPDIVQTHTAKAGALGRVAARIAGVKCVIHTFHGHVFQGYFSGPVTFLFLWIERWMARWTTKIVTLTRIQREDVLSRGIGSPSQVDVIPLGLELSRFLDLGAHRGHLRNELDIGPATCLVGIVARLVPIKNVDLFLEAAAQCTDLDIRFVVVGDGELRDPLEAKAEALGLTEDSLRFLGFRHDLERIYADLDVLVLTSHNEGSPVAVLEAMTAELPVVATAVGGVPDLVEDGVTGTLVRSGDADAVARAIRSRAMDPEGNREMGRNARTRVYPEYDLTTLVPRMTRLYDEALAMTVNQR